MDGVLRCSRYAFGPNRLHYCGPDANAEVKAYIDAGVSDVGLTKLLGQFKTMYPYLKHIAAANDIKDAFDPRVVEAYWIGNELLENISARALHRHLVEDHQAKRKLGAKSFSVVEKKIDQGALPHHSFHVLEVWRREGNTGNLHTLSGIDECRISWGKVLEVSGPSITVETEPLVLVENKLRLGTPVKKKLTRRLEAEYDIEQIKTGDIISIHWSVPCEVLSEAQLRWLKKFTLRHLTLANQTLELSK